MHKKIILYPNHEPLEFKKSIENYNYNVQNSILENSNNFKFINIYPENKYFTNTKLKYFKGLNDRIYKYFLYGKNIKHINYDICHVTDQSYAHLINYINPQKSILTVHDIIPYLNFYNKLHHEANQNKQYLSKYLTSYFNKFKRIIAVSTNTKNDLIKYLNINEEKIQVIYNGINTNFTKINNSTLNDFKLKYKIFHYNVNLLAIGNNFYKNTLTIFKAFVIYKAISSKNVKLFLVGSKNKYIEYCIVESNINENDIYFIENLSEEEMILLYNSLDCLIFPSLYEGFGFPPLEAMSCGLPVCTTYSGSLLELMNKEICLMSHPMDYIQIANNLNQLLNNEKLKNSLVTNGLKYSKDFSWNKSALLHINVYDSI